MIVCRHYYYYHLVARVKKTIFETLANSGDPYYTATRRFGITGPSFEARRVLLLPLRTLA
jgi:hypothetical protein